MHCALEKYIFNDIYLTCLIFTSTLNPTELVRVTYRVAQKNGATLSHCKYFENSMPELRGIGELLQYYMLNTVINFFCLKIISSRCGAT